MNQPYHYENSTYGEALRKRDREAAWVSAHGSFLDSEQYTLQSLYKLTGDRAYLQREQEVKKELSAWQEESLRRALEAMKWHKQQFGE